MTGKLDDRTRGAGAGGIPLSMASTASCPSMASMSDAAVMALVPTRGRDALAEVVRRYSGDLHALASRTVGESAAGDVTQDVLLRLWQHPERFDPDRGSLRNFLMMQTRSRAIDVLRTNGARRVRERSDADESPASSPAAEDALMADLQCHPAWAALSRLEARERVAISLAFYEGHSYKQVAEILQLPEGTVKSQIRTGLAHIRDQLTAAASASALGDPFSRGSASPGVAAATPMRRA